MTHMHRLTVRLHDEQHRALAETATRLGRTKSDLCREAVDVALAYYSNVEETFNAAITPTGAEAQKTAELRGSFVQRAKSGYFAELLDPETIAEVTGQPTEWVVPPGTV